MLTKQEFDTLPDYQKRIEVAKDVLQLINAKKIKPFCGVYLDSYEIKEELKHFNSADRVELKPLFEKYECEVCAKGALFFAEVLARNEFTVPGLNNRGLNQFGKFIRNAETEIINKLDFFTKDQLDLIEMFFEGSNISGNTNNQGYNKHAQKFFEAYGSVREILIAIMKNIIDNNGDFIPENLEY